jgi:hypothetical protein
VIFLTVRLIRPVAQVVLDQWRMDLNHQMPHGGLN